MVTQLTETETIEYEVFEDKFVPDSWRVEYDIAGECYVVIFVGPNSKERAEEYYLWKSQSNKQLLYQY
jgi:hypothetical protein